MIKLLLLLSPLGQYVTPIYEDIKLSEDLILRAEYVAVGQVVPREGMLLTVEDFVIISAELDHTGIACAGRLSAITDAHKLQIGTITQKCDEQYASYTTELDTARLELGVLHEELARERLWGKVYKWVAIGVGSVLLGASTYIILGG